MDLRQLTTFRMLAATLSFTRTANALNYVQSNVTAQIQALEEELSVPLFDRLGKRVVLTEAGKRLLDYAERILNLAEEARQAVTHDETPTGTVAICAPETLCTYRLPELLQTFHRRYPQITLQFRPAPFFEMQRMVTEGRVDVAFAIDQPLQSSVLNVETLLMEPLAILAAPDHPLTQRAAIQGLDLEGEPMLLTEVGCGYRNLFDHALRAVGVRPTTHLEFSSVEAIKQCVIAGMGIAFLPEIAVSQELAQGRMTVLQWEGQRFAVTTQMLWHKEKWLSPALQAFLATARDVLTGRDSLEQAAAM